MSEQAGAAGAERRAAAASDRRSGGRRRSDREGAGAATEAWLGSLPVADSGEPGTRRLRRSSGDASAFTRFYRLFIGARVVLGVALLAGHVGSSMAGLRSVMSPALLVSIAYAAQALALWWWPRLRSPPPGAALGGRATAATVGVDLAVFGALHLVAPSAGFNYVALLVLPVLMAAVLTPRLTSLGTAAAGTLVLLVGAWRGVLADGDAAVLMTQAGLAGIGLFVIALLAGELAARLAREEASARGSLELARQQAQLNRLVIEQMADGVLVIDRRMRVRAANPAARRLLAAEGLARAAPFELDRVPAWAGLAAAVADAFAHGSGDAPREAALDFGDGTQRTLRLRARFTGRRAEDGLAGDGQRSEELCVLFLEDLRTEQARMRQEKLAAMGRVSAGIAHEIRNPLAAIAQANALMEEDALSPHDQRLARIVADNVVRLKRIVDDVLEVVPGGEPRARRVELVGEVSAIVGEWVRTAGVGIGADSRLRVALPAPLLDGSPGLVVQFDIDHLRRVLVNLLDNAQRHASAAPGAIELAVAPTGDGRVRLVVASDGAPIPGDVERHLFEPFFSTRSRGTGLGLYICRELCERYGASIDYRLRGADEPNRNEFSVTMPLAVNDPPFTAPPP